MSETNVGLGSNLNLRSTPTSTEAGRRNDSSSDSNESNDEQLAENRQNNARYNLQTEIQNNNGDPERHQPPVVPVVAIPEDDEEAVVNVQIQMLKKVVEYELMDVAWWAVAGMISGWIMLLLPNLMSLSTSIVLASLVFLFGLFKVISREDISIRAPFLIMETRISQLMIFSGLCMIMDLLFEYLGPSFGLFHFKFQDADVFYQAVNHLRNTNFIDILKDSNLWLTINTQFFVISFSLLFLVNIPCSFYKMAKNAAIYEIFTYEFYAYFYPVGFILCGFFFTNLLADWIPISHQTILIWTLINVLLYTWIGILLVGTYFYPEIPIRRPMGIAGYMYMETITLIQMSSGAVLHGFLLLVRDVYFEVVPGAFKEAFQAPGFVNSAVLFYDQIGKKELTAWKYSQPYPFSYDLLHSVFFFVFVIRHLKLREFMFLMQERIGQEV